MLILFFIITNKVVSVNLNENEAYDYIVIGSGTGGVVATRLAEQKNKVLLIEAGPDDETYSCQYDPDTCIAAPFGDMIPGTPLIPDKSTWWTFVQDLRWQGTQSLPSYWNYNKTILNFTRNLNRGKMLGGCLSHNGHVWTRGSDRDFDYVAQKYNLSDWSFKNVLPFYQKLETYHGANKTYRGNNGPIHIHTTTLQNWQYSQLAFFNATIQSNLGLKYNNNQNGAYSQNGIGFRENNIAKYQNGTVGLFNTTYYRSASPQNYIRDIGLKSGYLTVWYNTTVQRILFDNYTKTAIGVEYYDANTTNLSSIYCTKEIILSAGGLQSPQLLMLSGIGPIDQLKKFNITPIYINDRIGEYGQEHLYVFYPFQVNMSYLAQNQNITHKRPESNTIFNSIFNRTEYFDIPGALDVFISTGKYDRLGMDYDDVRLEVYDEFVFIDTQLYSKNLTVKLRSLDARQFPEFGYNFFSDERDYDQIMEAILTVRKIFETNDNIFIDELYEFINSSSIEQIRDLIWKNSFPPNHAVGLVPMGFDSIYPVNTKCSIKGVNKLRVIDISIWPEATNSGTQSLAYMLGEKCAQHIIDDNKIISDDNWWNQNKIYVIITIAGVILFIVLGFIFCKYCKINSQNDKHIET
eukprot:241095_1